MSKDFTLIIANKNYSSWSLRPWVLMKELKIDFKEELIPFTGNGAFGKSSTMPSGRVPVLIHNDISVWDSLAITEFVAESYPQVWPASKAARAFARSVASEMHSGFGSLRSLCAMNCGVRVSVSSFDKIQNDIQRINEIIETAHFKFAGPFLAGEHFCAADAFFAPLAFRMQTYNIPFSDKAKAYFNMILALPSMKEWYVSAINEKWVDSAHDDDLVKAGVVTADLRILV